MQIIKAGQTVTDRKRISVFLTDDDTDLVPQTGVTIGGANALYWSKNGADEAAAGGTWVEPGGAGAGEGLYNYIPTDLEVDTAGYCSVRFVGTDIRTHVKDVQINTDDRMTT